MFHNQVLYNLISKSFLTNIDFTIVIYTSLNDVCIPNIHMGSCELKSKNMEKQICTECGHEHVPGTPCPECNCGRAICSICGHEHEPGTECHEPGCACGHNKP